MNEKCTQYFCDLLLLVENSMLVLRRHDRIKSGDLLGRLVALEQRIKDDKDYYTAPYSKHTLKRSHQAPLDAVLGLRGSGKPGSIHFDGREKSRSGKAPAELAQPRMTSAQALQSIESITVASPQLRTFSSPIVDSMNACGFEGQSAHDDDASMETPQTQPLSLNDSPKSSATMAEHLLTDFEGPLSTANWHAAWERLPANLRINLSFQLVDVDVPCWTCTPWTRSLPADKLFYPNSIPLTIAGAPVVIPIMYSTPIRAGVSPPKDPYPDAISPCRFLSAKVAGDIFSFFPDASGCYVLLNGFLQLPVPANFDLDLAQSTYPTRFGGLKVIFLPESTLPIPTSNSHTSSQTLPLSNLAPVVMGSTAVAKPTRVKGICKPESAKFGIKTRKSSDTFLTVSTHLITAALRSNKMAVSSSELEKVDIYSDSREDLLVR